MANLKFNEKQLFEKLFDRGGYVLNFSNRTKVKQLPDWSLSSLIDVAHEKGFIGLHVKKYSHSLRGFRNFIHPFEQHSNNFIPGKHTAKISWQVLQAVIDDLIRINKPN